MEYFPATRTKKEILAFVIIQMDLEDIMLSKINEEKRKCYEISRSSECKENKNKNKPLVFDNKMVPIRGKVGCI